MTNSSALAIEACGLVKAYRTTRAVDGVGLSVPHGGVFALPGPNGAGKAAGEEADQLSGRIAVIDHGRIVAEGTPAELKSAAAAGVIRLRLAGARDRLAGARDRLADARDRLADARLRLAGAREVLSRVPGVPVAREPDPSALSARVSADPHAADASEAVTWRPGPVPVHAGPAARGDRRRPARGHGPVHRRHVLGARAGPGDGLPAAQAPSRWSPPAARSPGAYVNVLGSAADADVTAA
ncbi:MAG TPA: hypothetical protein VKV38_02980 [Trebonia sp.]|nr:hypothetical protein [Trebonia sp.]